MDLAFLITEAVSIDAIEMTVPVIKQRKNQVSLWGVCGKASVVNKIHALSS